MSVILEVHSLVLRRGGLGSLRRAHSSNEVLFFKRGPVKDLTRLASAQVTVTSVQLVSSFLVLYLWPRLLAREWQRGIFCLRGNSADSFTNALPLCEGVPMTSAGQAYLFLTFLKINTIHTSFCAPIEREHELFFEFLSL